MKRRVAIIAGQLVVGGAERQLYLWLANMDRERFDPMVITLASRTADYWDEPVRALGIPLVRDTHSGNPGARLISLVRILREWRPELIHGWHLFAGAYAAAAARLLGVVGVSSLRSSAATFQSEYWSSWLSERLAHAMLINSKLAASQLAQSGRCLGQRVFVVQNGVEMPVLSHSEARQQVALALRLNSDTVWIGMMARMVPGKGFEPLLDLVAELRADGQPIGAVLIGDGSIRADLEARVDRLGIRDAVRFAGEVPDARDWIGALDLYCCLSVGEGMPNVLLEAAAAGVAIVGWRAAFAEEVLGPTAGAGLVPDGDTRALSQMVQRLIANPDDRQVLGQRGRDRVGVEFGIPQCVDGLTAMYEALLSR